MPVISDTRDMTVEQADALFAEYAEAAKRKARLQAMSEVRIAKEKQKTDEACAPHETRMREIEAQLAPWIRANAETHFKRPRTRATSQGRYGLQFDAKVKVEDAKTVIQHAKDAGDTDLYNVRETVSKDAVKTRIKRGETVPGARLVEGDLVVLRPSKAYLEED